MTSTRSANSRKPAIEFDHASFRLNGRPLLQDLVLSVKQGETLVLLGRSGSGKTTTLKLINRLLLPTAGDVRVNGRRTAEWDPIRLAAKHRVCHSGRRLVSTLHGGAQHRARAANRKLAAGARRSAGAGVARHSRAE